MKQIILDVETKLSFDTVGGYYPEKLGISFVGVIERHGLPEEGNVRESEYQLFESDLDQLWPLIESSDVVIGYNSDGFDLPALAPYYPGDITTFPSLDLMARIKNSLGRRISLDAIAQQTLGTKKSGDGLAAIAYYQNGELDKLAKYCMQDVALTRDIYDFGRRKGYVSYLNKWNNPHHIDVDFSFIPTTAPGFQMTLV
jgi:DEAD/DEAH box helicase domain-containing protein